MPTNLIYLSKSFAIFFCAFFIVSTTYAKPKKDKNKSFYGQRDSILRKVTLFDLETPTNNSNIDGIIWFAKQQIGTPYKYASANPKNGGLDCSGFLFYVFTHFDIKVPRSSKDYMNYGKPINKNEAQKGDVIVFTGSNAAQRVGGHVGIVLENNNGDLQFIHGSSGKGKCVTISNLSENYYTQRFLKVVRVVN